MKRRSNGRLISSRVRELRKALKHPELRAWLLKSGVNIEFKEEEEEKLQRDSKSLRMELSELAGHSEDFSATTTTDITTVLQDQQVAQQEEKPPGGTSEPSQGGNPVPTAAPPVAQEINNTNTPPKDSHRSLDDYVKASWPDVQKHAPPLVQLFTELTAHRRSAQPSYMHSYGHDRAREAPDQQARISLIVALAMGGYITAKNHLLQAIGMYLYSKRVPTRVQNALSQFGLCPTYKSSHLRVECLSLPSSVRYICLFVSNTIIGIRNERGDGMADGPEEGEVDMQMDTQIDEE
ncbi:hypothetical protein B0T17DRAFT_613592 [Bombardia bombarda]|uniref:Uncharacterized protein n=1 Tax=Bombardia bombarda TaxID=252184 RepID=A0AA39XMT3_9PEZI|nr:hypothetical protein B0T17DRAFT_613592 [Bombardia bombarda]